MPSQEEIDSMQKEATDTLALIAGQKYRSTSDARTQNNIMRHEYKVLTDEEKLQMKELKDMGLAFVRYCDAKGQSRELSLAKTKMEEAAMWAVKDITK